VRTGPLWARMATRVFALLAAVVFTPLFVLVEVVAALAEPQAYLDASLRDRYLGAVGRVRREAQP
jgi:hypothetical protein